MGLSWLAGMIYYSHTPGEGGGLPLDGVKYKYTNANKKDYTNTQTQTHNTQLQLHKYKYLAGRDDLLFTHSRREGALTLVHCCTIFL